MDKDLRKLFHITEYWIVRSSNSMDLQLTSPISPSMLHKSDFCKCFLSFNKYIISVTYNSFHDAKHGIQFTYNQTGKCKHLSQRGD